MRPKSKYIFVNPKNGFEVIILAYTNQSAVEELKLVVKKKQVKYFKLTK